MPNNPAASVRPKFWSDDFDMDLLKVFPNVVQMLREPDRAMWTIGGQTFGRLNHPAVWDAAILWLDKPILARDSHGWASIGYRVTDQPLIECTWLEWLRDAWSHGYCTLMMQNGILPRILPRMDANAFQRIMYALRGWDKRDVTVERAKAVNWVADCESTLMRLAP